MQETIKENSIQSAADKERGDVTKGIMYELLILAIKIVAIIVVFVGIFTFIFGIFRTADLSMHPAIRDGDLVIFYRFDKKYVASDTIIVTYNGEKQARRVVAIEGDTVDVKNGQLFVNNSVQMEREIHEKTDRYETDVDFPLTVGPGEVFVLGDGREHSTDSRVYGCVPVKKTLGKVTIIIRTRRT